MIIKSFHGHDMEYLKLRMINLPQGYYWSFGVEETKKCRKKGDDRVESSLLIYGKSLADKSHLIVVIYKVIH